MAFLPPQEKGILAHNARKNELAMKMEFIRTVLKIQKVGSKNHRLLTSVLENVEDRQEISQKQLDLVAYVYSRKAA